MAITEIPPFPLLETKFLEMLRQRGKSENTIKNYRTDVGSFAEYMSKKRSKPDIANISDNDFDEYNHFLQNKYKSTNSIRRKIQSLRIFFDFLVELEIFPENPVRRMPTSPKFLDIPRPTPFIDVKTIWVSLLEEGISKDRMTKLLAQRNQIILLLIFGAGLKVSDISNLTKEHVILGTIPRIMVTPPKRDPHSIPLPHIFTTIYNEYLQLLEEMKKKSKIEFVEILFNANPHQILAGGISARGIEMVFKYFSEKLMINSTPKSLRQACIFKWIHQQIKGPVIKEWLGVAPSYSLKHYKDHTTQYIYNDEFLAELHIHYNKKNP